MESGKIMDDAITASTSFAEYLSTGKARLNVHLEGCAWSPKDGDKQTAWIQVDLSDVMSVTGVATQGRCVHPQWVTSYTVSYSIDGQNWEFYKESGGTKVRSIHRERIRMSSLKAHTDRTRFAVTRRDISVFRSKYNCP